jgi:hypothetical protein
MIVGDVFTPRLLDLIREASWQEVERNAREVRLLKLEYKLGIGAFRKEAK